MQGAKAMNLSYVGDGSYKYPLVSLFNLVLLGGSLLNVFHMPYTALGPEDSVLVSRPSSSRQSDGEMGVNQTVTQIKAC
jgi:hypothetical protein